MSYIGHDTTARTFAPGWFLAKAECERKTREMSAEGATTTADGTKYVPMGTIYPANDATAEGIVYEDIDVTNGNKAGSVVLSGVVYEDRLAEAVDTAAKTALEGKGFTFVATAPEVVRPD